MTSLIKHQTHSTTLLPGRKLTVSGASITNKDVDGTTSKVILAAGESTVYRYLIPVYFTITALADVTVTEAADTIPTNDISVDLTPSLGGALSTNGKNINCADSVISRPELLDFSQSHSAPASVSNATTLDISNGNSFDMQLTESTTVTISNPSPTGKFCQVNIDIQQTGAGLFTVTWPASVLWPGGTAPVITTATGSIDKITLTTNDAGVSWYGTFSQDFQ